MPDFKLALAAVVAVGAVTVSFSAQATLLSYLGSDNGVANLSQMTNSQAARASFDAAVSAANSPTSLITFETAVPSGVTISGGSITNNSGCGALCGFNTTSGGQYFYLLYGGTATFTFTNPIDAFGMYITGLQTDLVPNETLTFADGSSETIDTPTATGGGGAFMGFTDFGKSIVSVSYNAVNDIVALDDVVYEPTTAAVPEPASFALLGTALIMAFGAIRLRREI